MENNDGKILMILASSNFRDEEYEIPRKIFEDAGYEVVIASSKVDNLQGMMGLTVKSDILIQNVNVDDYVAVLFIGGGGASEYWYNPIAHNIAKQTNDKGIILGAICIAPKTLAESGLLSSKQACGFSSITSDLASKGAIVKDEDVVVDGNIVTASGPEAATSFGSKIIELLK